MSDRAATLSLALSLIGVLAAMLALADWPRLAAWLQRWRRRA